MKGGLTQIAGITLTSQWTEWHRQSPARRLFTQSIIQAPIKNISYHDGTGFVRGSRRWPVNFTHKGPVTRKTFSFDDVNMEWCLEISIT